MRIAGAARFFRAARFFCRRRALLSFLRARSQPAGPCRWGAGSRQVRANANGSLSGGVFPFAPLQGLHSVWMFSSESSREIDRGMI